MLWLRASSRKAWAMAGEGSTAVTCRQRRARGRASRPGPEPTSMRVWWGWTSMASRSRRGSSVRWGSARKLTVMPCQWSSWGLGWSRRRSVWACSAWTMASHFLAALGVGMGLVCEGKILRLRFATLRMTCGGDGFPHAREQRERDGSPHARGQRVGDGGAANHPTGEDAVRHGVHPHPPSSRGQALTFPHQGGRDL